MDKYPRWWRKYRLALSIVFASVLVLLILWLYNFEWTGFGTYIPVTPTLVQSPASISQSSPMPEATTDPQVVAATPTIQPSPSSPSIPATRYKTLWDWLQLLIIPVALAVGGYMFNEAQKRVEHDIATDNQREDALQNYLDRMSALILQGRHVQQGIRAYTRTASRRRAPEHALTHRRAIVRAWTLTVLQTLDAQRKRAVVEFLYESEFIRTDSVNLESDDLPTISLKAANLRGVDLTGVYVPHIVLMEADLSEAILTDAKLHYAYLKGVIFVDAHLTNAQLFEARLQGANLQHADLTGAYLADASLDDAILIETNLVDATITDAQLARCKTLRGATLPDGTKVPDDVENPFR